ncbi:MAG: TonB-dependent receptor plug domain-containing protein, partial [Acidobacteriaceae bacterium]
MKTISAFILFFLLSAACIAQSGSPNVYSGAISNPAGKPVAGADVQLTISGQTLHAESGIDGSFAISTALNGPATVEARAAGFALLRQSMVPSHPARLTLTFATEEQRIVVTASRTPLELDQSANAVQTLSSRALQRTPALAFGDKVRQVTGLDFFRRSSTLVANPTSQGVSLRGLGSTAASRTLVLANGIPISDPFGGWVYWDQVPALAIRDVEVVSGGISSLYGSGAIGGVINILERQPNTTAYAIDTGYAQENTPHVSAMATRVLGPWSGMAAADLLRTDGYIVVAPDARGPIDTPANVHYENGEAYLRRVFAERAIAYLDGNVLNEARNNGTPLQKNATRFWRYSTGIDWTTERAGMFTVRLFGSQEQYRQSFSSVPAARTSEFLTRLQHVSTQQLGASGQWTKALPAHVQLVAGADADDVRATDYELPILHGSQNGLSDTSARQRDVGEYAEAIWQPTRWTLTASLRGDDFLNLDAEQYLQT